MHVPTLWTQAGGASQPEGVGGWRSKSTRKARSCGNTVEPRNLAAALRVSCINSSIEPEVSIYCAVEGGWPGTGNIDQDPLFADGDGRLSIASPCVDAGNNWGVARDIHDLDADGDTQELTPRDLDGGPRFTGDAGRPGSGCGAPVLVDMGAYELPGDEVGIVFADLDGDGNVGVSDLSMLNGCLGPPAGDCCIADLDLDDTVDAIDRRLLLSNMVQGVPPNTVATMRPNSGQPTIRASWKPGPRQASWSP